MIRNSTDRAAILIGATALILVVVGCLPRIPQDLRYHQFADTRSWLGVPNFLDVASNLPFLLVGPIGLWIVIRRREVLFHDPSEFWAYIALFGGTAMTAFGSGYYHWRPSNFTLAFDRLPMTVGFMGLLAALIAERVSVRVARLLLPALLILGAGSVVYWALTEARGAGDLRPYVATQFGALLLAILILVIYPATNRSQRLLVVALFAYALAKELEALDSQIFRLSGFVRGDPLNHRVAAASIALIGLSLVERRRPAINPLPASRNLLH